jgi:hypothetical protein
MFAGNSANDKITQMAGGHMLGKMDAKKYANILIEQVSFCLKTWQKK